MKRYCHLLVLVAAAASLMAGCMSGGDRAAEVTRWQVLYTQEPSLEAVSGLKGWKDVTVPFMVRTPYRPKRAIQYLWLRGEVNLANPGDYYGISLGKVYLVDRVYVNGTLVGQRLPSDVQELHYPRNYKIPDDVLVRGKNTVYVNLGIYGVEYGGLADRVRLLTRDLFQRTAIFMEFIYRQLTVGILLLFLIGIVFILMEFVWGRVKATDIMVLMILVIWISYLSAIFSPYYPVNMDFRITLIWSCASLIPIFFFLFIQYYYNVFLSTWNMIFIPVLLICAILSMINQDTTSPYYMGRVLGQFAVAISIPAHGYLFYYVMRRCRPDITILFFMLFGVLPAGVIIGDIINTMYVFHYPPLYHIYTLPALVILFVTLRIREAMTRRVRMEVLYGRLGYEIGDPLMAGAGSADVPDIGGEAALSPAMEERLHKVVGFLRTNYLSDISSNGLAMAMGLRRDRMEMIFKAYSGYRIGEYINRLRIEDAARQLRETDLGIAEIAFSVGFESVITFNRVFLRVMDMTPHEYRKNQMNAPA